MNGNEVKTAFAAFEPEHGAQERMYANIMKKAAAEKNSAAPKRRSVPSWRRWGGLAACLAVVLAAGIALPYLTGQDEQNEPPILSVSPFEDVSGPEDFAVLGFTIDAPEGAENVTYCIYDGKIARVDFTLDGYDYVCEAAELDGNFSIADGEAVGSVSLNAEYGATLDRLSPETWRAHWERDGVSYYLTNLDGAGEEAVTAAANALMEQS